VTGRFPGMLAAEETATAWQQWWRAMTGCWVGVERIRRLPKKEIGLSRSPNAAG